MKILKYITILSAVLVLFSCTKHKLKFDNIPVDETMAEFQLHYFEPINNVAANYIDSVYVNNTLYSSVNGAGQLLPYNGVPGGATGRFFTVKAGKVNFKFYRKENLIYDFDAELPARKNNVFVYDLTKAPVVIDNIYPYNDGLPKVPGTDSVAYVRFFNFLYENATTPYQGKLQYQYKDVRTNEWKNVGGPVAFGEATSREAVKVVKTVHNSSGYCRVYYRILDDNGDILKVANSSLKMIDYSDYWTTYIGRAYMHIFRGIRTAKPTCAVSVWTSL